MKHQYEILKSSGLTEDLHIDWQVENPLTSEKDLKGAFLKDFDSPFDYNDFKK